MTTPWPEPPSIRYPLLVEYLITEFTRWQLMTLLQPLPRTEGLVKIVMKREVPEEDDIPGGLAHALWARVQTLSPGEKTVVAPGFLSYKGDEPYLQQLKKQWQKQYS